MKLGLFCLSLVVEVVLGVVSVWYVQNIRFDFLYVFLRSMLLLCMTGGETMTERPWGWGCIFSLSFYSVLREFMSDKRMVKARCILTFPHYIRVRKNVFDWQCLYFGIERGLYFALAFKSFFICICIIRLGFVLPQYSLVC